MVGKPEERDRFEDLGVDDKILKFVIKIGWGNMSWINAVQDKTNVGFQ